MSSEKFSNENEESESQDFSNSSKKMSCDFSNSSGYLSHTSKKRANTEYTFSDGWSDLENKHSESDSDISDEEERKIFFPMKKIYSSQYISIYLTEDKDSVVKKYADDKDFYEDKRVYSVMQKIAPKKTLIEYRGVYKNGVDALEFKYYKNDDLFEYVKYSSPNQRAVMLKKVVEKMAVVHSLGYVHCDLKLENVFIDDDWEPLIADFAGYKIGQKVRPVYTEKRCDPRLYSDKKQEVYPDMDVVSMGIMYAKCFRVHLSHNPKFVKIKEWEKHDPIFMNFLNKCFAPSEYRFKNCGEMLFHEIYQSENEFNPDKNKVKMKWG